MTTLLLSIALLLGGDPDTGSRCSVVILGANPEGYFWPLRYIEAFVDSAEVIVRSRAERLHEPELGSDNSPRVQFTVVEVLKGDRSLKDLFVYGRSVDNDDFNPMPVPYRIVRMAGQRGDCMATEYKLGAEYLLLLRRIRGQLTPYWAPLAPNNEQIRGSNDPWVSWVRSQIGIQ